MGVGSWVGVGLGSWVGVGLGVLVSVGVGSWVGAAVGVLVGVGVGSWIGTDVASGGCVGVCVCITAGTAVVVPLDVPVGAGLSPQAFSVLMTSRPPKTARQRGWRMDTHNGWPQFTP